MEPGAQQAVFRFIEELLRAARPAGVERQAVVQALAQTLPRLEDSSMRQAVFQALRQADDPASLDALWQVWAETRQADLESLLVQMERPAVQPPALHVLSLLKLSQAASLENIGPETVEALLTSAQDPDPTVSEQARQSLGGLANPAAQEEVCRWVIEHDHPQARQAALQAGYAPRDLQRRALFFLLTEQWQRYETLDFDASLLRAVHQAAEPGLRQKIAQVARQAGWAGYVEALAGTGNAAGERSARRVENLSAAEWEVILALLSRHQRWEEAWRLAQSAPPRWSAHLLQNLLEAGWSPTGEAARQALHDLANAAAHCLAQGLPLEKLPRELRLLSQRAPARNFTHSAGPARPSSEINPGAPLAFSPQGDLLASGSDRSISLWDVETGSLHTRLEGHSGVVVSLAFSPDGQILASGSADRSIRLWQLAGGAKPILLGGHAGEVSDLAFSPDGRLLASADPVAVRLWDMQDGRLLHLLPVQEWGAVSLAFSPDGGILFSSHAGNALHLWTTHTGEPLGVLMEQVSSWAIHPAARTGQCLLATGSTYGQVRLWQAPPGALLQTLDGRIDGAHLAISPDGQILAASDRQRIRLWELAGALGSPLPTLENHTQRITSLAFSPDGRLLASGGEDQRLCLWQVPGGRLAHTQEGFSGGLHRLVFSPNGVQLACADAEKLCLLSLDDLGRILRTPVGRIGMQQSIQELLERNSLPGSSLPPAERAWLVFARDLYAWHGRFDIEIEDLQPRVLIGDFDIELAD